MNRRYIGISIRAIALVGALVIALIFLVPATPSGSAPRIIAAPLAPSHALPPQGIHKRLDTRIDSAQAIYAPLPASILLADPCVQYPLDEALKEIKALSASADGSATIYAKTLVDFTNALGCHDPEDPESLRQALEFSSLWGVVASRAASAQWAHERDPVFLERARQSSIDDCPAEQSEDARELCQSELYALRSVMPFSADEGSTAIAVDQLEAWRRIAIMTGSTETAAIARLGRWVEILGKEPRRDRSRRLWAKTLLPIFAPNEAID
jgi:hypothetical protein